MGLDTTHDCWHGAYSSFMRWRTDLCEVAGYGNIRNRDGFGGDEPWPEGDILVELLAHSDCDGDIKWEVCGQLADRLEQLLPALDRKQESEILGDCADRARQFIAGLRDAFEAHENVEFH